MTTTYVKHPVTGGAAEVARLVLTDRNGTPKEVSALWKDGVCLFAKKGALVKNGNEIEDIDGNDVMAWSLPSDTPIPRHTYPWESEIIPLHDEDRWYVIVPNSVVVTMGGVDITASCYDAETHKISIPMVKGDIVVEAEATEVIQFETEMQTLPSVTFLGQKEETTDEDFVDDGLSHIAQIEGNTFVWNQLLEHTGTQVETISTAVYYKRINGVESVFTSEGETITAETDTDMLINLTHLYGANARNFPLDPTNANTLAQFKTFFPLDYYPYSAPRLMNLAITSITASSNGLSMVFDFDVKNITGKLNGSGDSVKVFPDGMDNAGLADYIYNDAGVWKAVARNKRISIDLSERTYVSDGARRTSIGTGATNAPYYGTNSDEEVVCDHYMTSTFGRMYGGVDGEGYCAIRRKSNEYTCYFYVSNQDYAKGVENLPTVNIVYPLLNASTYILDDAWQTILDQTFHYTKSGILTTETNTAEPTTAPLTIAVASNIRGWKVKPICLKNWGENIIDGEITAKEAASVRTIKPTSANGYFYGCQMTKFNEFKYFVGLTELSTPNSTEGTFSGCTKLKEITLPKLNITSGSIFNGSIFRVCRALREVDLSPWATPSSLAVNIYCMFNSSGVERVDLRPFRLIAQANNVFQCSSTNPSYLEELNTEGCKFGTVALSTSAFVSCNKLTTIIGGFAGHKGSISFSTCPLTHESALVVLNSIATANSGATITFRASTYNTLTQEEIEIGTNKGYNIASS